MPINSAFKRSLLNVQSTNEKTFVDFPTGFSFISDPKSFDDPEVFVDSDESIESTKKGIAASVGSSVDYPEIISSLKLTTPLPKEDRNKLLDLMLMENQIDQSDYQFVLGQLPTQLSQTLQKRSSDSGVVLNENLAMISGLIEICRALQGYQKNLKLLKNDSLISKFRESIAGVEYPQYLSNTGVFLGTVYSQILPASCQFSWTNDFGSIFSPVIREDSIGTLLTALSQNNVTSSRGFQFIDSILPSDPIERISLIVEALSYELNLSIGLKKLGLSSVENFLTNTLGATYDPLGSPLDDNTYLSFIRQDKVLPLESKDLIVNSDSFDGSITGIIEPDLVSGDFSLNTLSNFTSLANGKVQRLKKDVSILSENYISEARISSLIFETISLILEQVNRQNEQLNPADIERARLGLSLLAQLMKVDNSNAREARFDVFCRAFQIERSSSQTILREIGTQFENAFGKAGSVEFFPENSTNRKGSSRLISNLFSNDVSQALAQNEETLTSDESNIDELTSISLRSQNASLSPSIIKIVSGKKFSDEMFPYSSFFDFNVSQPIGSTSRGNVEISENKISFILSSCIVTTLQPLRSLIEKILSESESKAGNRNAFQIETTANKLSKNAISFLLFQTIISSLSLLTSIKVNTAEPLEGTTSFETRSGTRTGPEPKVTCRFIIDGKGFTTNNLTEKECLERGGEVL